MSPTILTQHSTFIPIRSAKVRIINVTDCIPDIAYNYIHDSDHYQIPSEIFEDLILKALNELVDDFANDLAKYLKPEHETAIDQIAQDYLDN